MEHEQGSIFSTPFNLLPNGREIFEAFIDIPVSTFSISLGAVFWLILLWMPLSGIDRRDETAGLTYSYFMCFSGTLLTMTVSQPSETFSDFITHLIVVLVLFVVAKFRWSQRIEGLNKYKEMSTEEAAK